MGLNLNGAAAPGHHVPQLFSTHNRESLTRDPLNRDPRDLIKPILQGKITLVGTSASFWPLVCVFGEAERKWLLRANGVATARHSRSGANPIRIERLTHVIRVRLAPSNRQSSRVCLAYHFRDYEQPSPAERRLRECTPRWCAVSGRPLKGGVGLKEISPQSPGEIT